MANYYVYHAAAGGGTGADWTNAFTKLITAMAGKAAGDIFYVADDHSETQATAMTIVSPGTEANPCFVYCVNRATGSVPPVPADLRTTGVVATSGASTITMQGMVAECYGIIFNAGTSTSAASITIGGSAMTWRLVKCALRLTASATTSRINIGVNGANTTLTDTTFRFSATAQGIVPAGRVNIRYGSGQNLFDGTATIPTNLFIPGAGSGQLLVEGADFSSIPSGKYVLQTTGTVMFSATLKDCLLGLAGSYNSATIPSSGALELVLIRCDDTSVYKSEKITKTCRQSLSHGFLRTGGASDGTTPISWHVATGTTATLAAPFECLPISIWNETIGSPITVTIEAACVAIPNNRETWIEVAHLGVAGSSIALRATSGVASLLDTGTAYPAGAGGWTGLVSFAMSVTITPQEKGPIYIYVVLAKPSAVVYVDPKPVLS